MADMVLVCLHVMCSGRFFWQAHMAHIAACAQLEFQLLPMELGGRGCHVVLYSISALLQLFSY
jgi:hypothetical protein